MEPYLTELIIGWYNRARGVVTKFTGFDKFISLWISFNAWGTHESKQDSDNKMLIWAKNEKLLRESFDELSRLDQFRKMKEELQLHCPIPRHGKSKKGNIVAINIERWDEVLEAIYVIRCNLFHGWKSLNDVPDKKLVALAYGILSQVFGSVVTDLELSRLVKDRKEKEEPQELDEKHGWITIGSVNTTGE